MFKLLIIFCLLGFSGFSFSDTYPANRGYTVSPITQKASTQQGACDAYRSAYFPSLTITWNGTYCQKFSSTGTFMQNLVVGSAYYCPNGGTVSGSSCIDPACVSPLVRDPITRICAAPSVTCPNGSTAPTLAECPATCTLPQYNLNGVCTDTPDCNASWPTGGHFFDYGNKTCADGSELVLCVGADDKYCPPIKECKAPSHICTNDSTTVAAALAERTANIAAAKVSADAAAAKAAAAAAQAATPQAAAVQAKALAAANAATAKAALNAVTGNPDSTQQQLSDAVQALGNALKAETAAATRLDNTTNSGNQVAGHSSTAGQHAAAVPTDPTSSHAQNDASLAGQAADKAASALNDAIAGGGSGSGEQSQDTGGATEDTLGKVLDKLTAHSQPGAYSPGTANGGNSEKGSLNDMKDQGRDEIEAGKAELSAKIDEVRNGLAALGGEVSNGGGQLPIITVGTVKGVELKYDMDQYAEQFQPVSTAILALAWVTAFSIVLSR